MATRRIAAQDKTALAQGGAPSSPASGSSPSVEVPRDVIFKLAFFTLAMVIAPLGSYYLTVDTVFGGNTSYAGATAAIVANLVVAAFVVVAFREENKDRTREQEAKKAQ